jgi:hypothetical protein
MRVGILSWNIDIILQGKSKSKSFFVNNLPIHLFFRNTPRKAQISARNVSKPLASMK